MRFTSATHDLSFLVNKSRIMFVVRKETLNFKLLDGVKTLGSSRGGKTASIMTKTFVCPQRPLLTCGDARMHSHVF